MFSICKNSKYLYEIKKSKFYVLLYKIDDTNDVDKFLLEAKKEYKDATHYCYAYVIDGYSKASDDGEPSGTAGLPILEVLNKKNLDHILCIVVRYFGGIKLGAGGLIRAYANSVTEAINDNEIIELINGYLVEINESYDNKKEIEYLFKDNIKEAYYQDKIKYILEIDDLDKISKYNHKVLKEIKIKKD